MLPIVTIKTEILPIAAVGGIIVVIVILMMHREFVQIGRGKLAAAAGAHVRMQAQRLFAVTTHARCRVLVCLGHNLIEFIGIKLTAARFTRPVFVRHSLISRWVSQII